jgi:hypothetical protein
MIIKFNFIYCSGCFFTCQSKSGSVLRNTLYNLPSNIVFTSLPIVLDGQVTTAPRIQLIQVLYVSPIRKNILLKSAIIDF